jgi:hypothetical protein
MLLAVVALAALVAAGASASALAAGGSKNKRKKSEVRFRVRIENISSAEGQTARDGNRWPFALSPGLFIIDGRDEPLFKVGQRAGAGGLEAQAEDGNPEWLVRTLEVRRHMQHGVFNTPVGESTPGPVGPSGAYEFTFTATPGRKLSFVTMFGQSNDLFYAPARSVELFEAGQPVSGDITARVMLFDAGTEVNQEPGVGPDQAPRQKARNTGAPERKAIGMVSDGFSYPKTSEVIRVTITPEM